MKTDWGEMLAESTRSSLTTLLVAVSRYKASGLLNANGKLRSYSIPEM